MRNVFLYGRLAEEFGEKWSLEVNNVREACRAITVNTGGKFREVLRNLRVSVIRGEDLSGEVLSEDTIDMNYTTGDFHIVPEGSGAGLDPITLLIGGAILLGAGLFFFGDKIFPFNPPSVGDDDSDPTTSNLFGQVINSANQGQPIPLIYGECFVGSIIISQGMRTSEVA